MTRPTLTTPRLRLEPLAAGHTEDLVALDSDPEVLRHIFGRALTRDEVIDDWLPKRTDRAAAGRGLGYWAGFVDDTFVGWWCLAFDPASPETAELGYRLRREAWGRGLATEGARAMLRHAFGTVGLPRVWAETMAVNTGSRSVLTKLRMRLLRTEVREWPYPVAGAELGEVIYEITREEWTDAQ